MTLTTAELNEPVVGVEHFVSTADYPELRDIPVACTVAVGDRDRTTPAFHSQSMAKLIPSASLVSLPGVGHLANWEAVDVLA